MDDNSTIVKALKLAVNYAIERRLLGTKQQIYGVGRNQAVTGTRIRSLFG